MTNQPTAVSKNMQWDNWFGMMLAMVVGTTVSRNVIVGAALLAALCATREISYAIRSRGNQ